MISEADLYAFLKTYRLGVLGSVNAEGNPQAALVGFAVTPALEIIFDTVRNSRKYPNLIQKPQCTFTIGGWGESEQTVQYEGIARELLPPELGDYQKTYFETWPDGPARLNWSGIVYFAVRPVWIRFSNFDRNPPLIQEFRFPPE